MASTPMAPASPIANSPTFGGKWLIGINAQMIICSWRMRLFDRCLFGLLSFRPQQAEGGHLSIRVHPRSQPVQTIFLECCSLVSEATFHHIIYLRWLPKFSMPSVNLALALQLWVPLRRKLCTMVGVKHMSLHVIA